MKVIDGGPTTAEELARATRLWVVYLSWSGLEEHEGDVMRDDGPVPLLSPAQRFALLFREQYVLEMSEEQAWEMFDSVVGDEGPTKTNPYAGPARVYAYDLLDDAHARSRRVVLPAYAAHDHGHAYRDHRRAGCAYARTVRRSQAFVLAPRPRSVHHRVMEEPDALFNVGPSRLAPGKIFLGVGEWPEGATVQLDVAESQRLRKRLADAELQVLGSIFSDVGTTQLAAPSLTALPEWDEWAGLTKGEG